MMKILAASLLILITSSAFAGGGPLLRLRAEIGGASCVQDAQCRTVAVGAKSCGGPEFYLPWSLIEGKADKIAALAKQYTDARVEQIKQSGEQSTCQFLADPGSVCKQKQCVLKDDKAM
ncbi:MAG: hypothetical protein K2Q15_01245 [Burkholderiales bacterium]|nr:hypothetical protein [Burkholderiales bacterium]